MNARTNAGSMSARATLSGLGEHFLAAIGGGLLLAASATAAAQSFTIDFETPAIGAGASHVVIDPYTAAGVTFSADDANGVVGLVKNSGTSACVDPSDDDQKLGTATGSGSVGFSGFAIRAEFAEPLAAGSTVSVDFQVLAGTEVRLRLFDAAGTEVGSSSLTADPPVGNCGFPGEARARTRVSAAAKSPVASAVMDLGAATGGRVFVLDDFTVDAGTEPPAASILYIHGSDVEAAERYRTILEERGFSIELVPVAQTALLELAGRELVMVGGDVGTADWPEAFLQALQASSLPVLGLGEGGVGLFASFGLTLGAVDSIQLRFAAGPFITDLRSPFLFFCDSGVLISPLEPVVSMYREPGLQAGLIGIDTSKLEVIAVDELDTDSVTLAVEANRFVYSGYSEPPTTEDGEGLLASIVERALDLDSPAVSGERLELINWREANLQPFDGRVLVPVLRPDFEGTGLEITQAIQCFGSSVAGCEGGDNSLPLATNRSTAVRVYMRLTGGLVFLDRYDDVPVRLYVKAGSGLGARVFSLDGAGSAARVPDRTEATHSANFFLSIDGEGTVPVRMCAVVDPDNEVLESSETNNRVPVLGSIAKDFEERRQVEVNAAPIDYRRNASDGALVPGNVVVTSRATQWLNKVWPVPDQPTGMDYNVTGSIRWDANPDGDLSTGDGQHALIQSMNGTWVLANLLVALVGGDVPVSDFYYGWIGAARFSGGHADMPIYPHAGGLGVVGIGDDSTANTFPDRGTAIYGHELTHDFDVLHTNTADGCGSTDSSADFPYASSSIQEVGFDPITGRVYDPANTHDLMSYCPAGGTTEGWISPFTWNKIWDEFAPSASLASAGTAGADLASAADMVSATSGLGEILVVRGRVTRPDLGDGGEIGSTHVIPDSGVEFHNHPGDYSIVLLDAAGNALLERTFEVSFKSGSVPGAPLVDHAEFLLTLPLPAGTALVELRHGDVVLDTLVGGTGSFTARFEGFAGGRLDGPVTVRWSASGAAAPSFALLYLRRPGADPLPLMPDLPRTSYVLDPSTLPSTEEGRLILIASGALQTERVQSAPFSIAGKPPRVGIDNPEDGDVFGALDAIVLRGTGMDVDDGTLPAPDLHWESSLTGPLGEGNVLALPPSSAGGLPPGEHVISLTGTDSDGQSASASVSIRVLAPPEVSLTGNPLVGLAPLTVVFDAIASDDDGAVVEFLWDFESDTAVDEVTTDGTTVFTYDADGSYLATVGAVDDDGAVTYATVEIGVGEDACAAADETPPDLWVDARPQLLTPANHKLVEVELAIDATDSCTPEPELLVSVYSDEPDDARGGGDGSTTGDVQVLAPDATVVAQSSAAAPVVEFVPADGALWLRAERQGKGDGRVYTIEVRARDARGNEATRTVEIRVPHDNGQAGMSQPGAGNQGRRK